jgi:hypothetical protein
MSDWSVRVVLFVLVVSFAIVFLCINQSESAEWRAVGGTHKYDLYADMQSIGPFKHTVTLWTLKDFKVLRTVPGATYRSLRIKKQFDCRSGRGRQLLLKYYADGMAGGRIVVSAKGTRQWSRVIPGSDQEAEWKVACRLN